MFFFFICTLFLNKTIKNVDTQDLNPGNCFNPNPPLLLTKILGEGPDKKKRCIVMFIT